ncbi:MAG: PSD1 and planctomycete cytochrome C domain-containing protein [Bryobacteraceae bacterium]|nr:PSD1 and planctomycete cytochrome C domain-containing protein [Bryobacteraceae bacterium]
MLLLLLALAQSPDLFESKIRPVLAKSCYGCHSSKLKAPMGGLVLDTKAGLRAIVAPGKPAESKLLQALSYEDQHLQMPPSGKLAAPVLENFTRWVAEGALDPRPDAAAPANAPLKGMSVADGRKWWAFQPLAESPAPVVLNKAWPKRRIDSYLLAKLEEKKLTPSPRANARVLAQRAYLDLLGMRPTYAEIEAFAQDTSPNAYEKLIDKLLASPHYGEAWGRHWLDVARYAEDNPTSEATNPPYPYAWRYRDWVIEALNRDEPYDRFVQLQLAADLMPGTPRLDLRALGYLGTAPVYHKDQRLSLDVISTFLADDWDERVDAVSRGLLGMSVACARCHDHKFDPIPTKDYYGLAGVFASTMRSERPLFDVDPQVETRYQWLERRLFDLSYSRNTLVGEPTTVIGSEARVALWKEEIAKLRAEAETLPPKLAANLEKYWRDPAAKPVPPPKLVADATGRRRPGASNEPFMNTVYDAAQYVDGSDANYTWIHYKPGESRDLPVFLRGNAASPGEITPRHFLSVLAREDATLGPGSGRLTLARKIFTDSAPLAARVIVNRVWGWHFGKALVGTPSDFGTQGDLPTHPALLDDLAARFVQNGWSLKWLHREIMLSAAYQQASQRRPDGDRIDQANTLLWRMSPQRLTVEAYRDSLLRAAGTLDATPFGVSQDLDLATNHRRTIYGRIGRGGLNGLLKIYDFPDASQTSPGRDLTTTPLQQLFVLNGAFVSRQAEAAAKRVTDTRSLYRQILSRDPSPREIDLAASYLANSSLAEYAHVLLSTNEVLFRP